MWLIDALLYPFRRIACEFKARSLRAQLEEQYPEGGAFLLKQKLIVRTDLKMRRGKEIAQAAHASQLLNLMHQFDPHVCLWLKGKFTKVALGIPSEAELLEIYEQAKYAQIPCSIIQDAGKTEFNGVPTYTAVAIGPGDPELVEKLTRDLKLR